MKRIAVYGTLKEGFNAHSILKEMGAEFIKKGFFEVPYRMFHTGYFPVLLKDTKLNDICFEIYNIDDDTEKALDIYEGYPDLFNKDVLDIDGVETTIYIGGESFNNNNYREIKDGNFQG